MKFVLCSYKALTGLSEKGLVSTKPQIYEENKHDLHTLLRLHKIVSGLGMDEMEIINVLELAKHNQLQNLQWKVEYLINEIDMIEL